MAWLRNMMTRVAANLRGLSIAQRLVILMGGLLVGGSLLWLVQWAAAPEMRPLLGQDLEPEEIDEARLVLEQMNEPFEVKGNRIFVRASANQSALLARLSLEGKLPSSTSAGFASLVKQNNPWLSQEENNRRWTVALAQELRNVLQRFGGVRSADVFLDLSGRQRRMIGRQVASRASVTLTMKGGLPVTRKLALGAARLVSGAIRGVDLKNVNVVDGSSGASALEWESDNPDSGPALHKLKSQQEKQIAAKIKAQLGDPRARVSVQVTLDMTSTTTQSNTPIDGVPLKEETDESDRVRGASAAQPGAQANVGVSANAGGGQNSESRTTRMTEFQVGQTIQSQQTSSGTIKEISAAINISFSYLKEVYRRQNPDADDPTNSQIIEVFDNEKSRIISQAAQLVRPADPQQVAVDWYYDSATLALDPQGGADEGAVLGSAMELAKRYAPQSALGLLALTSFALMLNLSRKIDASDSVGLEIGLPAEHIEAAKQAARDVANEVRHAGPPKVESELTIPEAKATAMAQGMLVGKEVDQSTLQMQSMLDQVRNFIEHDPETVANLFERWIKDD